MIRLTATFALCATSAVAQDTAEAALARATLNALQEMSFRENREFCGYIIRTPDGGMAATPATRGKEGECFVTTVDDDAILLASYHTHGAFDYDVPAEFPSVSDVEADEEEGVDGYVSTPGGRFWYVDSTALVVSQICSIGCLKQDPAFVAGLDGDIALSYTYEELLALEGN